jgi:transposase-like protein
MKDVQEADRLYDRMPLYKVAKQMDITAKTLSKWKDQGLISTDEKHNTSYSAQTISRANELYDFMPISEIAEVMDLPLSTLGSWRKRGWISTEVDWVSKNCGAKRKANPQQAVRLVHEQGMTYQEAGERLGVSSSTIGKYIREYRNGDL